MKIGEPAPVPTKTAVVAELVHQLVDRDRLADDHVAHELDAERLQVLDVLVDDLLRQPVLGDAVAEDAAERVQRLEDRHRVAELREVAGRGEAGRARADDADLLVAPRLRARAASPLCPFARSQSATKRSSRPMPTGSCRGTSTQRASHWCSTGQTRPQIAGSRLRRRIVRGSAREVAHRDVADEVADRDVDRAALLAHGVLAVAGSGAPRRWRARRCSPRRPRPSSGGAPPGLGMASRSCADTRWAWRLPPAPARELAGQVLLLLVRRHAVVGLVEVDLVGVEERAVDAGEQRLAADVTRGSRRTCPSRRPSAGRARPWRAGRGAASSSRRRASSASGRRRSSA